MPLLTIFIFAITFTSFYTRTNSYAKTPRPMMFLKGYGFASFHISLLCNLSSWTLKTFFLIFSLFVRFIILGVFDIRSLNPEVMIAHVLIDLFLVMTFYIQETADKYLLKRVYRAQQEHKMLRERVRASSCFNFMVVNPKINKIVFSTRAVFSLLKNIELNSDLTFDPSTMYSAVGGDINFMMSVLSLLKVTGKSQPKSLIQYLQQLPLISSENETLLIPAFYYSKGKLKEIDVFITKSIWKSEEAIALEFSEKVEDNSLKDKMIAVVSHELRTPLNGILGLLTLAKKLIHEIDAMHYIDLCQDNINLLLNLVNSLLDIQQVQESKLKLNISKIDIQKCFSNIAALFSFQCQQRNIFLKVEVSREILQSSIYSDEERLKQIIINLIGNALKFTFHGGITIHVDEDLRDQHSVRVSVKDSGIGIKQEDMDKLFRDYGKLENGNDFNKGGVGLGLSISNGLVKLLSEGKRDGLQVESQIGCGSEFSFCFLKDLRRRAEEEPKNGLMEGLQLRNKRSSTEANITAFEHLESSMGVGKRITAYHLTGLNYIKESLRGIGTSTKIVKKHPQTKRWNILVVDDNPFNLLIAEKIITGLEHCLKTCQSGSEAIEAVKENTFNLILMDCQMPAMDGYTATTILRDLMESNEIPQIPIIALTSALGQDEIDKCFECGMTDFLSKPLSEENLTRIINSLLR